MKIGPALLLIAILGLTACGASEPTRFYLLSPEPAGSAEQLAGPVVFVDQATIAPYLDRAQIVSRVAPDQVAFADVRTWAEPVTSMITRYIVDEHDGARQVFRRAGRLRAEQVEARRLRGTAGREPERGDEQQRRPDPHGGGPPRLPRIRTSG